MVTPTSPEPIRNPGVTPTPASQGPDAQHPMTGAGEDAQPKPFEMGGKEPTALPGQAGVAPSEKPNPMDIAREGSKKQQWTPEEMEENAQKVQNNLSDAKTALTDPNVTQRLTPDHYQALGKLTDKMTPDMKTIAKETGGEFTPPAKAKGESALSQVLHWIGSAQDTMTGSLQSLGNLQNPNPASFLKLQFAMHRAQERSELFSTIVGAGVGTIKQIMSTQLG